MALLGGLARTLTQKWLPNKQLTLRPGTWANRLNIELHVLADLGRIPLRHLPPEHLERLSATLLESERGNGKSGLDTKTVLEATWCCAGRSLTRCVAG